MVYNFDLATYLENHPIASEQTIAQANNVSTDAVAYRAKKLEIKLPRSHKAATLKDNSKQLRPKQLQPSDQTLLIRAYIKRHPQDTLQSIGDHFGLSRERIRQIAKQANIQRGWGERPVLCLRCRQHKTREAFSINPSGQRFANCQACRLAFQQNRKKPSILLCDRCGEFYTISVTQGYAKKRNRRIGRSKTNVCPQCFHPGQTQVSCATCGHIFEVWPGRVREAKAAGKPFYCSKDCFLHRYRKSPEHKPNITFEARFWAKVNKTATCWLWTGATTAQVYGRIKSSAQKGKWLTAHKVAWEWQNDEIPSGVRMKHSCPNKHCVNPEHLYLA